MEPDNLLASGCFPELKIESSFDRGATDLRGRVTHQIVS
jgi:hypothetical protein